jgi:hypothetical protein
MSAVEDELEKAHQDYEERKARILANLECISGNLRADPTIPDLYSDWIDKTIEFINEKEI